MSNWVTFFISASQWIW